jgi:hydrogenase-4 component H
MSDVPVIDGAKCDGCGLCVSVCVCGGLQISGNVVKPVPGVNCLWCATCELVCPSGAITCPYDIVVEENID